MMLDMPVRLAHPPAARTSAAVPAVVLAGGPGTRMGSLTRDQPKHLLEVAGEPVLVHQLRWLAHHGVLDVVLATSYLAEQFAPLLGDGSRWGVRLRYVTEETPLGTGGALAHATRHLDLPADGLLVVVNGDLLAGHDLGAQLAMATHPSDLVPDAVLHLRTVADARPYGCVVAAADGQVSTFLEKSPVPPSTEVNGGTYVLRCSALDRVPDGVVSLEKDVLPTLVGHGRVVAYREQALWEDVGTPAALMRASRTLVELSGRSFHIDSSSHVHATAQVGDGSAVGPDAVVGAGASVLASVVMRGARVGAGATVVRSVVGPGARVPPAGVVADGVVS